MSLKLQKFYKLCYKVFQLIQISNYQSLKEELKLIMTENNPKPKIMVENISCVLPEQHNLGGLFLGNVYGAQNPTILKEYGIRAVLTSSIETNISYEFLDIPFHMKIQAHDKENYNLKEHINKCIDFIQKSRQLTNVYVHCFAGVSRSVAIVCAYIMWKLKWNYETTIAFVKAKRIVAKPNQGFVQQLRQIQQILMQSSYLQTQSESKVQLPDSSQTIQTYNIATPQSQSLYEQKYSVTTTQEKQIKKQHLFQERNNISLNNSHHVDPYSTPSSKLAQQNHDHLYKNSNHAYKSPRHSDFLKEAHLTENYYNPNQSQQIYLQTQKKQKNDRFMYLQNFFPQNHSTTKAPQVTKPQSNYSPTSSAQNWMNNQKVGTSRQSLKKLQNTQSSSIKHQSNYPLQKHSNPSNYLILGGKKQTYNHNSIPVPKVVERKQQNKNYQNPNNKTNGQIYQTNDLYKALNEINSNSRTKMGQDFGMLSSRTKQYMWNDPLKAEQPMNYHNLGYKSPVSKNIYNQRFEFRSSAPSEGFYTSKNSVQKRESQKETSRCLVRPKDLPGYKNY